MSTIKHHLTVAEVAAHFDASIWAVRYWIRSFYLPCIRGGNSCLVPSWALKGFKPPKRGRPVRREVKAIGK
jgi:hypothetical protein